MEIHPVDAEYGADNGDNSSMKCHLCGEPLSAHENKHHVWNYRKVYLVPDKTMEEAIEEIDGEEILS